MVQRRSPWLWRLRSPALRLPRPRPPGLKGPVRRAARWSCSTGAGQNDFARASALAVLSRHSLRRAGPMVPRGGRRYGGGAAGESFGHFARRIKATPPCGPWSGSCSADSRFLPADPAIVNPDAGFPTLPGADLIPYQWYLRREGFPQAWDLSRGAGVIVGVIDSGSTPLTPSWRARSSPSATRTRRHRRSRRRGRSRHPRRRAGVRGDQQPERDRGRGLRLQPPDGEERPVERQRDRLDRRRGRPRREGDQHELRRRPRVAGRAARDLATRCATTSC